MSSDFRRIRQHNGEIVGGAKATSGHRPWEIVYAVTGFRTQREALQFEWALKHLSGGKRGRAHGHGLKGRFRNMHRVLAKPQWTELSPPASEVALTIEWHDVELRPTDFAAGLPSHITELARSGGIARHG